MVQMTCTLCGYKTPDESNIKFAVENLAEHFEWHVKRGEMTKKKQ